MFGDFLALILRDPETLLQEMEQWGFLRYCSHLFVSAVLQIFFTEKGRGVNYREAEKLGDF